MEGNNENPIEVESSEQASNAVAESGKRVVLKWVPPGRKTRKRKGTAKVNPPPPVRTQPVQPEKPAYKAEPSSGDIDPEIAELMRRKKSWVWNHFTLVRKGADLLAECKYCDASYLAGGKVHGTGNMSNHLELQCTTYQSLQDSNQNNLVYDKKDESNVVLKPTHYCYEDSRMKLVKMIVVHEFAFSVVEYEWFIIFVASLQPKFTLPSRHTISRDCMKLYLEEKQKVKRLLKSERVCLTTDAWTSLTNLTYMCLTSHWIDKDWKLHKRILSFAVMPNHKGKTIGKFIENRLIEWGIDKVLTLTVDNASANDGAINYVRKNTKDWKGTVLNHEFLHMRCCSHILNLIVRAGLEHQSDSIFKIRKAIRYVRSSLARLDAFKKCASAVKIESKSLLCLDVETRWNSTYKMLEIALKFEKVFDRLIEEDSEYKLFFSCDETENDEGEEHQIDGVNLGTDSSAKRRKKKLGAPLETDWAAARVFVKFLKIFYDVTLMFSGTLNVTSNLFFKELVAVQAALQSLSQQNDVNVSLMASKMKEKFSKYWEDLGKLNFLLYVAVILDPRYKMKFVKWCLDQVYVNDYDKTKSTIMFEEVRRTFSRLYDYYLNCEAKRARENTPSGSSKVIVEVMDIDNMGPSMSLTSQFASYLEETESVEKKSEIDKYLDETCVKENAAFDVLGWWSRNNKEYPVLSCMARDVLAIPISTVASESTFSTGGRILSPYRSSLNPEMVEALVCCQNWIRSGHSLLDVQESMKAVPMEDAEKYAEILKEFHGLDSRGNIEVLDE